MRSALREPSPRGRWSTPGHPSAWLLEQARSDPHAAILAGPGALEVARAAGDARAEVAALQALGEAFRYAGTLPSSIEYLEQASRVADLAGLSAEAAAARITVADSLFAAGRKRDALRALTRAGRGADPLTRARVDFERATIYARSGRWQLADCLYERALPVFVFESDARFQAMTHRSRAMLSLLAGHVERAGEGLRAARHLYQHLGHEIQVAYVNHDLGLVAAYQGAVVDALRLFDESEASIARLGGSVAQVQAARCETMLSAGLFAEAQQLADAAAGRLGANGGLIEQAELMLISANASILRKQYRRAEAIADRVIETLEALPWPGWAAAAREVRLRACAAHHPPTAGLRNEAVELGAELEAAGHLVPAAHLSLLAVRLSIALGDLPAAASTLDGLPVSSGPIELRVDTWVGRALLREAAGNRRGALAAARAGLGVLAHYQDAVGAADVRTGMSHHGHELVEVGMRCALASGRPRSVLGWMELSHAHDLMRRPLRPADDPELAGDLAELRHLSGEVRRSPPAELRRLLQRQARLQNRIRRHTHRLAGTQSTRRVADAGAVIEGLGDRTLVSFAQSSGILWSVVVARGRARLRHNGDVGEIVRIAAECRGALDLAARPGSARFDRLAAAERLAADLDGRLLAGVPTDRPVVIVADAGLLALPWGLLERIRDNPFSVAPSATSLLLADTRPGGRGVVAAAGPDLEFADDEARRVARCYPNARHLPASRARSGAVLESLEGAALAHVVCHGHFNAEQGLFSTLRLQDGDLTLLDLHSLRAPPAVMVLSACDTGLSGETAGRELLSLTGSLLAMGSSAVVAATGNVPDGPAMPRLMEQLHGYLASGDSVALGLAKLRGGATGEDDRIAAGGFLCFGSNTAKVRASSTRF